MLNKALCKQYMALALENLHFLFASIWRHFKILASKASRDMELACLSCGINCQLESAGQPVLKPLWCNEDKAPGWTTL